MSVLPCGVTVSAAVAKGSVSDMATASSLSDQSNKQPQECQSDLQIPNLSAMKRRS